ALEKALDTIDANLERIVQKEKISAADKKATLKRIDTTTTMDTFAKHDFVVEAATENEEVKKKIFAELQQYVKKEALLASNTSSLSITRLGTYSGRPEQFI